MVMGEQPAPSASFSGLGVAGSPQGGGEAMEKVVREILEAWGVGNRSSDLAAVAGAQTLHSPGAVPPSLITQTL